MQVRIAQVVSSIAHSISIYEEALSTMTATLIELIKNTKQWDASAEKKLRAHVVKNPSSAQESVEDRIFGTPITPLITAIEKQAPLSVIAFLIDEWPASLQKGNPLSKAVENDSLDVIKYIVEKDASTLGERSPGSLNYGWTPLMTAVSSDASFEVVSYLVEKDDGEIVHESNTGLTPIHNALWDEWVDSEILTYLVKSFPEYLDCKNDEGQRPINLVTALHHGSDIASILLRGQIIFDGGICLKGDEQPPWGDYSGEDETNREFFPLFCSLATEMNDQVKRVSLSGVVFKQDQWKLLVKTLKTLEHVKSLTSSDIKIGDGGKRTSDELGNELLDALQEKNPEITGKIGEKEIPDKAGGKRKRE